MSGPAVIRGILPLLDADWLERVELISAADVRRFRSGAPAVITTIARSFDELAIPSVQLRCKGAGRRCTEFVSLWVDALRQYSPRVAIVINDHLELAVALAADGVHVGQEDQPVATCRQRLGPDKLIGLSTHSPAEVLAANRAEVDYIGFGPLFTTHTKQDAQAAQGVARLAEACRLARKPVVAIGGIQSSDAERIAAAGAAAMAMISGLWERENWRERMEGAVSAWGSCQQAQTR
ncbi:MAG: thiamine phosphate synthase [Magnetococcus sp. XQGC-1]